MPDARGDVSRFRSLRIEAEGLGFGDSGGELAFASRLGIVGVQL